MTKFEKKTWILRESICKKSKKFMEIPGQFDVLNMAGAYGFLSGKAHSVTDP